jgi:hypothetical protein
VAGTKTKVRQIKLPIHIKFIISFGRWKRSSCPQSETSLDQEIIPVIPTGMVELS